MTPESSEQPRETREGLPLSERFDGLVERITSENRHPETQVGKVSSPELASLAAKYVNWTSEDVRYAVEGSRVASMAADIRSLAASVLSQSEPDRAGE